MTVLMKMLLNNFILSHLQLVCQEDRSKVFAVAKFTNESFKVEGNGVYHNKRRQLGTSYHLSH